MTATETTTTTTTEKAEKIVRVQRNIRVITTWPDVDRAMGVLRYLEAELAQVTVQYDEEIANLQEQKRCAVAPLQARKERIEALITEFAEANRDTLKKGAKSVKMVHGTLGWRKATAKVEFLVDEAHTLALAVKRGLSALYKMVPKLDKTALARLTHGEQTALQVRLVQAEALYVKLSADPAIDYPATESAEDGAE